MIRGRRERERTRKKERKKEKREREGERESDKMRTMFVMRGCDTWRLTKTKNGTMPKGKI